MDSEWRSLATTMEHHGEMWWKRSSLHGVPWTASGEVWQLPWSPMERCGGFVATVPWRGVVETWQPPWSPMEKCGGKRGSFHGVPWSAQFWIRVLMDGHDSWYWNALDSRSSEVSVLISGRLRRMVNEVFWKHFRVVYSWSTMSSSFCLLFCLVAHR